MEADLFKLWFDHGKDPSGVTYQYMLVPGADQEQLENLNNDFPFEIRNGKNIQAVLSNDNSVTGIVFYQAGKLTGDSGIEVNKPCILMLKEKPDGLQVSIADPTQSENEIEITLKGKFKHDRAEFEGEKTKIKILLPQGGEAGKTRTLVLKQD